MYQCHKFYTENGEKYWKIWEINSDQYIGSYALEEEARKTIRFYNRGGGFNGFTPAFMLTRVKLSDTDINTSFQNVFADDEPMEKRE